MSITTNLFFVFAIPFVVAWFYLIIPNEDYWVFNIVKGFYWAAVTMACYIESVDLYYPGLPDAYYNRAYVIGITLPLVLHVIAWFTYTQNNFFFNTIIATSPVLVVIAAYGIFEINFDHLECKGNTTHYDSPLASHSKQSLTLQSSFNSNEIELNPMQRSAEVVPVSSHGTSADSRSESMLDHHANMPHVNNIFRYLPRYWFRLYGRIPETKLIGNRLHHWLNLCLFMLLCNLMYLFSVVIAYYFNVDANMADRSMWFEVFVIVSSMLRIGLKSVGSSLDQYIVPKSYYAMIIGEIVGLFLYYMFYRILFESLKSWYMFMIMQLLHLSSEWMMYPFRASIMYSDFAKYFSFLNSESDLSMSASISLGQNSMSALAASLSPEAAVVPTATVAASPPSTTESNPNMSAHENIRLFRVSLAIEFGLRIANMTCTGVGVVVMMITASYVPWVNNRLGARTEKKMNTVIALIVISLALEWINAALINRIFARYYNLDILELAREIFDNNIRLSVSVMLIASSLVIVALVAFTTDDVFVH